MTIEQMQNEINYLKRMLAEELRLLTFNKRFYKAEITQLKEENATLVDALDSIAAHKYLPENLQSYFQGLDKASLVKMLVGDTEEAREALKQVNREGEI